MTKHTPHVSKVDKKLDKKPSRTSNWAPIIRLIPEPLVEKLAKWWAIILILAAMLIGLVSLTNPELGESLEEGLDSFSDALLTEIAPSPNYAINLIE